MYSTLRNKARKLEAELKPTDRIIVAEKRDGGLYEWGSGVFLAEDENELDCDVLLCAVWVGEDDDI